MKPCYEGLKEIGVDVNEIWRKMLCFRVSIGLLPLILIISWNETLLWRFERNQSWCQWDMKENVGFRVSIGLLPLILIVCMKWNPVMKVWKKSELMSMRYEGKCCGFRVSIGLLPLILIISKWNVMKVWKKFRVDVNEIWRKMLCFRVSIGLLPLILIVSWNETPVMKVWKKSELMFMRYEGKC